MTPDADLFARFARLFDCAERGGADPAWLDETADQIVALLNRDPRRVATLVEAERLEALIAAARRAGYDERDAVAAVRARLGFTHSKFYRLRRMFRDFAKPPWRKITQKRSVAEWK